MFEFDILNPTYPSRRSVVYAKRGMVATSQHLASQAGLEMLKIGGNAIDAAIATAICMTVVEEGANGIGGDTFALVWTKDKEMHAINGSGPTPLAIDPEELRAQGITTIPQTGWLPVTVPGTPSAWAELSEKFGKLPFEKLFEPAIYYAENGFVVTPTNAHIWELGDGLFRKQNDPIFDPFFEAFNIDGHAPRAGETWKCQDMADTLKSLAKTKCESFYRGELADRIDKYSKETGGYIRKEDLETYKAEWVTPITTNYRGYDVWELPPNPQGIIAQMALNIVEGYEFKERDCIDTYHKQIEALKLAFVDAERHVADPRYMKVTTDELLSKDYAAKRREEIGDMAIMPKPGDPRQGGTIYLCTADDEGNMVSLIQSVYKPFGSGVVVPGTGIALQCRGFLSPLDENDVNCYMPGKKPRHTIIPTFLTKDGEAIGPIGVMGGFMQPQGQMQMIMNLVDFGLSPQDALDAPRWEWIGKKTVRIENTTDPEIIEGLKAKGHDVVVPEFSHVPFGKGQIILRTPDGNLMGATESRADGSCVAW